MKRGLVTGTLTLIILAASASIADAQVVIQYKKKGKNYSIDATFSGGYYSGYGYGGYYGYPYSPYGYTAGYGSYYGGYYGSGYAPGYYGGAPYYPYHGWRSDYYPYRPTYSPASQPSAERLEKMKAQKEIDSGLSRFKAGDYAGALAFFKVAVGTDTENPLPQLLMGLALAGLGDFKNSEKAFRSAFATLAPSDAVSIEFGKMFRDAKEQARYVAAVEKDPGLTAGVVAMLMGDAAKAKAAFKKLAADAVVKKLLDHVSK